jgi:putative ABC transport system ATP-binding protein
MPDGQGPPLVAIKGVDYSFGSGESLKQVLFDNNLEVYPGEIVIMTGPSGSGKTTLLTLIGALRAMQSGSLLALGQELLGLDAAGQIAIRRNIGFIFQQHNLFESLTAYQNVMLAAEVTGRPHRQCRQMTEDTLKSLGLGHRMHYKPHGLSGGQRQRVAIARALVHKPRLVLADEPTAALDKDTGREVVTLFQELAAKQGSSILIVTHDNRILDVAHRIVNMIDGCIVSDLNIAQTLQDASFLRRCPAFANTAPAFLAEAAGRMLSERFPAGVEVITQGDVGDKFYVIHSGKVEIIKTVEGQTRNFGHLGAGDFFGELALLDEKPRAATIRTVEPTELASLGKDDFNALVEASVDFEEQLRKTYFYR